MDGARFEKGMQRTIGRLVWIAAALLVLQAWGCEKKHSKFEKARSGVESHVKYGSNQGSAGGTAVEGSPDPEQAARREAQQQRGRAGGTEDELNIDGLDESSGAGTSRSDESGSGGAEAGSIEELGETSAEAPSAPSESESEDDGKSKKKEKSESERTWKRSEIVPNTSKISVGEDRDLEIRGMQTKVHIDGFRARVLTDFYFYNPDDQRYEGTFKARLPNGASPYFLAFGRSAFELESERPDPRYDDKKEMRGQGLTPDDIMQARHKEWIDPKEARVVPKKKAARAYKETVRQQIDPALMEWAGPGVFSARVFPVQPKKLHRVVLGYDVNLKRVGDGLAFRFPVPRNTPSSVVDVDLRSLEGAEVTVEPETEVLKDGARRYLRFENPEAEVLRIRLEDVGSTALTGRDGTGAYFASRFQPDLARGVSVEGSERAVFAVDASMSSNPDRFNIWLKLMQAILEKNRDHLDEFAVLFFNVDTFWWRRRFVENTPDNVETLREYANSLALEGATDLGATLREASQPDWAGEGGGHDLFLLSDGAVTWGEQERYALSKELKDGRASALFAYRTGISGENTGMLRHLARESGGAVFSVMGESAIQKAATAHTARPWTIRDVRLEGASDLLLAGRPKTLFPGQRLVLVGRGSLEAGAEVELALERGDQSTTVDVPLDHVVDSPLASRAYGQIAIGQLEQFLGATRTFAEAYARHFRVAKKSSSLLMLESQADYEQYDIHPKDDASMVERKTATGLVKRALDELARKLGNPKAAFMDWIDELEETRGVDLDPPKHFETTLSKMPSEAFEVESRALDTDEQTWKAVSKGLTAQLKKRKPTYETVFDDARERKQQYGAADGLKALSSLVEANPGDGVIARDVGYTAMSWGLHQQAYHLFKRVAEARPFEPQTYHAIALNLAEAGRSDLALAYFELALAGHWDERFGSFRRIVLFDYFRFLRSTPDKHFSKSVASFADERIEEIRARVMIDEADIVVTITWNTDSTDVDLHVTEPSGEECYYSHRHTESGGELTHDVTEGFGPEMYVLEQAPSGEYEVEAKYYETNRNRSTTRTKVYATIYRNWGTPQSSVTRKTITLEKRKQMTDIATLEVN